MLSKLIVAKVSRINDVLRINSSAVAGVGIFAIIIIPIVVVLFAMDYKGIGKYAGVIFPLLFLNFVLIYQFLTAANSRDMTISKRFGIDILIGNDRDAEHLKIKTPSFVRLTVKPKKRNIKVTIGTKRRTIAEYRLQNETDLTRLVDGIMEILNMELESTEQEGKVDVLTFVAKNK